jgi:acylphosphatase
MERRTLHFSGRVQGVGFRYTTQRLSAGRAVNGFVRNLPDGRVELVVEGVPAEIEAFVAVISGHFGDSIRNIDQVESPATGQYKGFEIRR